jgi:Rad3-related DNA helicase
VLPPGVLRAPDLETMATAADVVVALDPLTPGGLPAGLSEALAARRPLVLTAGSPAAADLPEGTVAVVEPGRHEEAELAALLRHLLRHPELRARLGALAADEARRVADPATVAEALVAFLLGLEKEKGAILAAVRDTRAREDTLLGYLAEEVRSAARSLGLHGSDLGLEPLLEPLLRSSR